MKTPTKEECLGLLDNNKTPENVIAHSKAVAVAAGEIADKLMANGVKVDREMAIAGALLHDIERIKKNHSIDGAKLLDGLGYPKLANIAKTHGLYRSDEEEFQPKTVEEKIVFYADKIIDHEERVNVEERFEGLNERHGTERFGREYKLTKDIEKELIAMMGKKALVLFDIDGTITEVSKKHGECFDLALKKAHGVEVSVNSINLQGMVDKEIAYNLLKRKGFNDKDIEDKMDELMDLLACSFRGSGEKLKLFKGVGELLEELEKKNCLIGLVTGNPRRIANAKTRILGISHHFILGGFGDKNANRLEALNAALEEAKEYEFRPEKNNTFLIGDTPTDVSAAKQAGITAIGVATGKFSAEELKGAGADHVFENLSDYKKVAKLISNNKEE